MSPRTMAVAFTALMLASTLPVSEARHIDPLLPDVPTLPQVYPTQDCLPVGLDAELLTRVNQAIAGDPAFYQDDLGIPSLCVQGGPVTEFQRLINDGNAMLAHVRNVSAEIQRQANWRAENLLPESEYPFELVEPRTILLNDSFNGFRTGGFGDWNVVTEKGEEPLWSIERIQDVNGTSYAYRFGDDEGYASGAHQWLVSPELDLTALKGNRTVVRDLTYLRAQASNFMRDSCSRSVGNIFPAPLGPVCGEEGNILDQLGGSANLPIGGATALLAAYDLAFEEVIQELPVMQHGAELDITYRLNMAPGEDGVRLWIYSGDRAPDRRDLYSAELATGESRDCAFNPQVPGASDALDAAGAGPEQTLAALDGTPVFTLACTPRHDRGYAIQPNQMYPIVGQDTGYRAVPIFPPTDPNRMSDSAFTGDVAQWVTIRVNLTDWLEDRVWVLFEVRTEDNVRGEDIFSDTSRFPRQKDFGFQLGRVYAEGAGYHRNFRLKDVAATYGYATIPNENDDPETTRTTNPPGNAPIVAWVHNAGDYNENGTLEITARARSNQTSSSFTTLGTTAVNVTLRPDEVRAVSIPWPRLLRPDHPTLKENWLYEVTATLVEAPWNSTTVPDQTENLGQGTPPILDPNVTRVQPPNVAGVQGLNAGALTLTQLVRASSDREVTLVRADRQVGNPLQLCRVAASLESCDEHYAGPKGEPRMVLVGVRNDGNAPQNITLELTASLDGVGKPDIVTDGGRKVARDVLPGEIRAVSWIVLATQPGAYELTITPIPEVPAGVLPPKVDNAQRKLFVQRSTGLLCLDTLEERECGPKLMGDLVMQLRGEDITAATVGADGTLYVATAIREAEENLHRGLLAYRSPSGEWRVLANLSGSVLNESLRAPPREGFGWGSIASIVPAPDGSLYLAGRNNTLLRYFPGNGTVLAVATNTTLETDLRAAAWYKGTLLVAGANGWLHTLVNDTLEPFNVTHLEYNETGRITKRYEGNFTSLVVAPNGQAVAAGTGGAVLRHTGASVTAGWVDARAADGRLLSDALENRTIYSLAVHDGRVVLGSTGRWTDLNSSVSPLWTSKKDSTLDWISIPAPAPYPEHGPQTIRGFGTLQGALVVLQDGQIVACSECFSGLPRWDVLTPQYPTVTSRDVAAHPAAPYFLRDTARGLTVLGEAGFALDVVDRDTYDNALDWTVSPQLAPRDGGVIQTRRGSGPNAYTGAGISSHYEAILLVPDLEHDQIAQSASRFRVYLNHSLNWTNAKDLQNPDPKGVEVRVVYRNYPATRVAPSATAQVLTCSGAIAPGAANAGNTSAVCENNLFRSPIAHFTDPMSPGDGWSYVTREVPSATAATNGLAFWGLEFLATDGVRWAMDDVVLQGLVGSDWVDIASWHGPRKYSGDWYIEDLNNAVFRKFVTVPNVGIRQPLDVPDIEWPENTPQAIPNTVESIPDEVPPRNVGTPSGTGSVLAGTIGTAASAYQWEVFPGAPFDLMVQSPWHISNDYADRPVFAANNEQYKPGWSDPRGPRLLSNWDARLVSPVIDLTDAYDPVITWRQSYSFRTQTLRPETGAPSVQVGDGGFVEIQYTMKGEECGDGITDPDFTCWSRFYGVAPDDGYPMRDEVGFGDVPASQYYAYPATGTLTAAAYPPVKGRIGQGLSYWGAIARPDESGAIGDTRRTESYETQRITLEKPKALCVDQELTDLAASVAKRIDCIPHNLTGRQIRVAFHLMTAGDWEHLTSGPGYATGEFKTSTETIYNQSNSPATQTSFPGEGWYITDFRVLGAEQLGIDLKATNLTFAVGYDFAKIGVGPGTRVPVNVTIENRGVFEALGYTGRLEIRRVSASLPGGSELVEVVNLAQQPVLDAGGSRNHTMFWNVPATEDARYALTFTVTPIGIDRDEDHLDNTDRLGTSIDPILAKTKRQMNIEFLVSPEEATADITRYLPMFVNNTGNVPLASIDVERRISAIGSDSADAITCAQWRALVAAGTPSSIVDCRAWRTQRPAPAGMLTPLTILSDEVNPSADLFWKAPQRASFLVNMIARTTDGGAEVVSTSERRVTAFATYLFDDVEGGPRGEALAGGWTYGPGWAPAKPGFRSTDSYAFGDVELDRFPADTEGSIVAPTIDLGSARTARLALFTNFDFEAGFDGAVIEMSDDGGRSWTAVTPLADPLLSASYNTSYPMQASSALHPDGDPERLAYAFTSDSALLPSSIDGWSLSQTDLTRYANITETDVEYEAYHAAELSRYTDPPTAAPTLGDNAYFAADWCVGAAEDARCWESHNLTQGLRAPTAAPGQKDNTFWWSGTASMADDMVRPVTNNLLEFPVDLSGVSADQTVMADWWEYGTRFNARSVYLDASDARTAKTLKVPGLHTAHTYHAGQAGDNYRFNLGQPRVVETRGHWFHMQADMTDIVERLGDNKVVTIGFAYTPLTKYAANFTCTATACAATGEDWTYISNLTGTLAATYSPIASVDAGFAVDGFKIETFTLTRGTPGPRTTLVDEERAWSDATVYECGVGGVQAQNSTAKWQTQSTYVGCAKANEEFIRRPLPESLKVVGRSWALVTEIPGINATWRKVAVTDHAGHSATNRLPTGDTPYAWYTGDISCRDVLNPSANASAVYCPNPNGEARLVTPAFDLSRIAGEDAALSFWHRFGFHQRNVADTPLASGGVVEVSVLDPQTGEWGAWEQLYSSPDFTAGDTTPGRGEGRGGYTGFTANFSSTTEGPRRYDPPFHNVVPEDRDEAVQFLFTGNSTLIESEAHTPDGAVDGWLYEKFDVSKYLGRKVRFGFHYALNGAPATVQQATHVDIGGGLRSGWWISDIAVVGDVLVGKPVQLRVRAATDGNVHDGHLQIDDIGVFGARYRNNVGIFVDETNDTYGAYPQTTTTVPVTLRNLGDAVRRNLALEVRVVGDGVKVSGVGPEGNATFEGALYLTGFTLGPGQSRTVNLTVQTPKDFAGTHAKIVLQLREANPNSQTRPFGPIVDNEVQGLLARTIDFRFQRQGEFERGAASIRQAAPRIGEPVDFVLAGRNPGHGAITIEATCTARTITGYDERDHEDEGTEDPVVAASYPCAIAGDLQLARKEWTNLTFRATPTAAGFLAFDVNLHTIDPMGNHANVTIPTAGVPVGVPMVAFRETFDNLTSLDNFTGEFGNDGWSKTRGRLKPGALELGIEEPQALAGSAYNVCPTGCKATTPPIDLHNYSATAPAFLSFYHLDRMARHDGAQVRAQVLIDEASPSAERSWSKECVLKAPITGYEGAIQQKPAIAADPTGQGGDPGDPNPVFGTAGDYPTSGSITPPHFFVSPGGLWEESWSLAVFRLPETCAATDGSGSTKLLGRTVRFTFVMYPGGPVGDLRRGPGHGFLVDEISVGPLALEVRPAAPQKATLLDNTTKGFNVRLKNLGSLPDLVTLEFDALNSSAPAGSVAVPTTAIAIPPGETRTATVRVTLPRDPSLLPTEFTARILAHSVLDPNAAGATRLDLTFGPREWAELAVTVETPRGIVQEATETFIPITVENSGLADSVDTKLHVIDEWIGGRIVHELELPSMPSYAQAPDEALRVLEFRWRPERGSVGPHTLTFVADPAGLGEEYTRTNNLVQIVVPVSDLLIPDLYVANFSALRIRNAVGGTVTPGFDADVARYEVTAGEVVSFDLRVANRGRAGATDVEVRAFIGALSLPPKTIPYIAPGTEAVVTFNWLAQKGEHEIEFIVRNEQVELTQANNRYPGLGVTLLTVKGYEVVVEIDAPTTLLAPASEIMVPFRITNNGNAGEDLELRATTPAGMRLQLPRSGFFLRAGETYEDRARLILDAEAVAGQQFISIDAMARENPMKVATGRAGVGVLASYGGSIAGGFAAGAPPEIVVPVELVNEGNSLEPWNVTLTLPLGWSTTEKQPARIVVPAHDRATFEFHVKVPAGTAPGDRVVAVKAVMPNGEAREGVARVAVSPLRAASVVVRDEVPAPVKGELAVPIRVQNTGNVREPFSLLLVDPPAGLEMRVEPAEFLLAPGAEAVATLVVKPNATIEAGTYAISGFTRFAGVVPQTREGLANVQTLRIPIVRQDLRVTALEFSPRSEIDAGDRVSVRASVQNFGQSEVADVPVHLFVDDVFAGEVLVARIAPGARADVSFNWTAIDGVHTLTAVADPYEDTVDAGREDNAVSALATVGVEAATGGVAAGRADAPFGGLWLVAVALLVVAVWRRERR